MMGACEKIQTDYISHYGTPRHSGRYPWGSGENPYQHNASTIRKIKEYRDKGYSEGDIARIMGYKSSVELKAREQAMKNNNKKADYDYANKLKNKGYSNQAIADKMGLPNESSVRSLLKADRKFSADETDRVISELKKGVAKTGFLEIGRGNEIALNTTADRLNKAAVLIQDEGYTILEVPIKQQTQDKQWTTLKVLAPAGTEKADVYKNLDKLQSLTQLNPVEGSENLTKLGIQKPKSIDSSRIKINYADTGNGEAKDGMIEIRRGVPDLSLGEDRYSQVRIAVDDKYYIKGMGIYSDNIPDGYDIVVNSNKTSDKSLSSVLKPLETNADGSINWENPFGSQIKLEGGQSTYTDANGKEQLSAINKIREEGDWAQWKNNHTLASQMLAKQPVALAKQQLKLTQEIQQSEYDEIMSITNPTVKRQMLLEFADECDTMAYNLKAAGMPRQSTKVILPVTTLKDNEVYAPSYNDGETVVLIRYPHEGRFQIPELTVNNRNKEGRELLSGISKDAIGINKNVADTMSGADFDGDNVLVIPNNSGSIKTMKPLKDLEGFDTKAAYPYREGMKVLPASRTNMEMGKASNLITDMTLQGAAPDELARAVKYSMTVIDAAKHKLDYTRSYEENGIAELKKKYQAKDDGGYGGATTLLSRAKSPLYVDKRKGSYKIDPKTGEKIWNLSDARHIDSKTGEEVPFKQKVPTLGLVKDAHEISTGHPMEEVYANHSNAMKALANKARLSSVGLKTEYNSEAAKTYAPEVASIKAKLNIAMSNAPKEKIAQAKASTIAYELIKAGNVEDKKEKSKIRAQALAKARADTGAAKKPIELTSNEWKAIQAGAVHDTTLKKVFDNSKSDQIKKLAMPKQNNGMTDANVRMAKSMADRGYTLAEIASQLGFSTSTISKAISS